MFAAEAGHPECIEALVRHGANVEIQNKVWLLLNYLNFDVVLYLEHFLLILKLYYLCQMKIVQFLSVWIR